MYDELMALFPPSPPAATVARLVHGGHSHADDLRNYPTASHTIASSSSSSSAADGQSRFFGSHVTPSSHLFPASHSPSSYSPSSYGGGQGTGVGTDQHHDHHNIAYPSSSYHSQPQQQLHYHHSPSGLTGGAFVGTGAPFLSTNPSMLSSSGGGGGDPVVVSLQASAAAALQVRRTRALNPLFLNPFSTPLSILLFFIISSHTGIVTSNSCLYIP